MPLKAHLVEARNRLIVAAAAVVLGAVAGWFLYDFVYGLLTRPLEGLQERANVNVNFQGVTTAFDLQVKTAIWVGVVLASPVWIYQIFAFVLPGLTRRERWTALGFLGAALPLFAGGIVVAWLVVPQAIGFLIELTPSGGLASNILPVDQYLMFVLRVLLAFGLSFLTPVVMVALTMLGLVSARTWVKGWRVAIVLCFVFAALVSPTPDIVTMFALAGPIIALYFAAVVVALAIDRRRARRSSVVDGVEITDEEASPLPEAT